MTKEIMVFLFIFLWTTVILIYSQATHHPTPFRAEFQGVQYNYEKRFVDQKK